MAEAAGALGKQAFKKIEWKNIMTYVRITVWCSIVGQIVLCGYLMSKILDRDDGDDNTLWGLAAGIVQMLCGFVVCFFEIIPCLKCCEKTEAFAEKMELCMSLPMLRSFLYMALSILQGAMIVYALTRELHKQAFNVGMMFLATVLLLAAGLLYMVHFIRVQKCRWIKPGEDPHGFAPDDEPCCTLPECPKYDFKNPKEVTHCHFSGKKFGMFDKKVQCGFCGNIFLKQYVPYQAVPKPPARRFWTKMCVNCKEKDDNAPKDAGEKIKSGFANIFGGGFKSEKKSAASRKDGKKDIEEGRRGGRSSGRYASRNNRNSRGRPSNRSDNPFFR